MAGKGMAGRPSVIEAVSARRPCRRALDRTIGLRGAGTDRCRRSRRGRGAWATSNRRRRGPVSAGRHRRRLVCSRRPATAHRPRRSSPTSAAAKKRSTHPRPNDVAAPTSRQASRRRDRGPPRTVDRRPDRPTTAQHPRPDPPRGRDPPTADEHPAVSPEPGPGRHRRIVTTEDDEPLHGTAPPRTGRSRSG